MVEDSDRSDAFLNELLDQYLPAKWDDSPSREKQIMAVAQVFLEDTDPNESTKERRQIGRAHV